MTRSALDLFMLKDHLATSEVTKGVEKVKHGEKSRVTVNQLDHHYGILSLENVRGEVS